MKLLYWRKDPLLFSFLLVGLILFVSLTSAHAGVLDDSVDLGDGWYYHENLGYFNANSYDNSLD